MSNEELSKPAPEAASPQAEGMRKITTPEEHISGAQGSLKSLRQRIGEHPELEDAITRLEMALSILTVNSGGML